MGTTGIRAREPGRPASRFRDKRRGKRMNSRVPVRLEWDAADGQRIRIEAHTRVVNNYGCMVVMPHSLELEHRLALTNLATQTTAVAVIVWKGNPRPEGWEYGVEMVSPDLDFWGIDL